MLPLRLFDSELPATLPRQLENRARRLFSTLPSDSIQPFVSSDRAPGRGALFDSEHVFGQLLNSLSDTVAVHGPKDRAFNTSRSEPCPAAGSGFCLPPDVPHFARGEHGRNNLP